MTTPLPGKSSIVAAVSVVIPCFNPRPDWLQETLESLRAQTLLPSELIIVDDGSTNPDTLSLLDSLRGSAQVIHQTNQGPGPSRNAGVQRATGEFVLVIDADDLLRADGLEALVTLLRARPEASFAYSQLEAFGAHSEQHAVPPFNGYLQLEENFAVSCALFRRAAILEQELAWPSMRGYEDWAFWVGCAEKDLVGAVSEEPLFRYRAKRADGVNAAADRQREDLKQEIERLHPQVYSEAGRARLKQRWAPGLELVWLGTPDEAARFRASIERQSLKDLIVSPRRPGDAQALLASARGKYLALAGPAQLSLLERASENSLEQLIQIAEANPERGAFAMRAEREDELILFRSWHLARQGTAGVPVGLKQENLPAHALESLPAMRMENDLSATPIGKPPPQPGLQATMRSTARGLLARALGERRTAALLHPWKLRFGSERAIESPFLPTSRLTELRLCDAQPVHFERVSLLREPVPRL